MKEEARIFYEIKLLRGLVGHIENSSIRNTTKINPEKDKCQLLLNSAILSLRENAILEPFNVRGELTDDYFNWYDWWNKYLHTLSTESLKEFSKRFSTNTTLVQFYPEGNWRVEDTKKTSL